MSPGATPSDTTSVSRISHAQRVEWGIAAGLVLSILLVYGACLGHPFLHFDDLGFVTENRHVQSGLNAESIGWAFTTFECGNWHPLTWLSLLLDREVYGVQNAGGFHLTNVLLHTASTLLLFLVLNRMTGYVWRS